MADPGLSLSRCAALQTISIEPVAGRRENGASNSAAPFRPASMASASASRPGPAHSKPVSHAAPADAHRRQPAARLERPQQHRTAFFAHDVEAPVQPVGTVDIGVSRQTEHGAVAGSCGLESCARQDHRAHRPPPLRSSRRFHRPPMSCRQGQAPRCAPDARTSASTPWDCRTRRPPSSNRGSQQAVSQKTPAKQNRLAASAAKASARPV